MWDNFLLNYPNIWGNRTKEHEKSPAIAGLFLFDRGVRAELDHGAFDHDGGPYVVARFVPGPDARVQPLAGMGQHLLRDGQDGGKIGVVRNLHGAADGACHKDGGLVRAPPAGVEEKFDLLPHHPAGKDFLFGHGALHSVEIKSQHGKPPFKLDGNFTPFYIKGQIPPPLHDSVQQGTVKLQFVGMPPRAMRARCCGNDTHPARARTVCGDSPPN